ncbi:MAG: hypothetical protein UT34_C0001G0049 [candidate division WS6 bacterium GW2011_GWF2_39_15]|uniref:ABC3 transporter permease C-terminal domain-containing protein n=1 Tax=candidate division WS6 bacterium GW2011_GWF2_39_15 TaxID=1619100 RepID=A0A0G0MPM0_9BACT|nr:MAG: hypothetical protein UT34_C0001G0049 [candidate division WS6 bacterium GW2011_GWF2_39_15]
MRITDILSINVKKLKTRAKKALFLIIPVLTLVTLSVIITSQIQNIKTALNISVFDTIADQYTLLEVKTQQEEFNPSQFFKNTGSIEDNRFSQADVNTVSTIEGVKSADLQSNLPVRLVETTDLFPDKTLKFNNLTTLNADAAKLYTEEDFSYTEGETIPIILNASSLIYSYEDWSEGNTITLDMSKAISITPGSGESAKRMSFLKTESLDYNKGNLLGTEFTLSFGGLESITDYTVSRNEGVVTMTKMTDAEMSEKVEERKDAISEYWDYKKISTPITYKFKVVGIIEDEKIVSNYIPAQFAQKVMKDLTTNEINARVSADLPNDILSSDFSGLTYNGDEISQGFGGFVGQLGKRLETNIQIGGPRAGGSVSFSPDGIQTYAIPGLIIETNDSNEVVGEVNDTDIYEKANKYGDVLSLVVEDINKRAEVITALNRAGYAYQDLGDLEVFEKLEGNLGAISNGLLVSFVVLLIATIVFTMSKFVSESTKEIGIFRAIGMKSSTVLTLFILQSFLYVSIGYLSGIGLGIGLNFVASSAVAAWFKSFIDQTVSQSFDVIRIADSSIFLAINWQSILLYTVILFVLTIFVSLIPSFTASKISPVEAMKNE